MWMDGWAEPPGETVTIKSHYTTDSGLVLLGSCYRPPAEEMGDKAGTR